MELKHQEITSEIIRAAFEVFNILGYGFLEKVYQRSMQVELIQRGLLAELEYPIQVKYKGTIVGDYAADLFVERKGIAELIVAREYQVQDEAQVLNELKASGVEVGVLINFGREGVKVRRFIF